MFCDIHFLFPVSSRLRWGDKSIWWFISCHRLFHYVVWSVWKVSKFPTRFHCVSGPCKIILPKFLALAGKYPSVQFFKVSYLFKTFQIRLNNSTAVCGWFDASSFISYEKRRFFIMTSLFYSHILIVQGIRSVPAFHFWRQGEKVGTVVGARIEDVEAVITGDNNWDIASTYKKIIAKIHLGYYFFTDTVHLYLCVRT